MEDALRQLEADNQYLRQLLAVLEQKVAILEEEIRLHKTYRHHAEALSFPIVVTKAVNLPSSFRPAGSEQAPEHPSFQPATYNHDPEHKSFQPAITDRKEEHPSFQAVTYKHDPEHPSFQAVIHGGNPGHPSFQPKTDNHHFGPSATPPQTTGQAAEPAALQAMKNNMLAGKLFDASMKKCGMTVAQNAATLLWLLREDNHLSYAAMRKLLRMSEGGVAKHMMRMRQHGLITSIGKQKYQPTPKAMQWMDEVLEKLAARNAT